MNLDKISEIISNPSWVALFLKEVFIGNENLKNYIKNPNEIVIRLNFNSNDSYLRGSFGELHKNITEYTFKNCSLLSILILTSCKEPIEFILNSYFPVDSLIKNEYAQYYRSIDLKDSNKVTRYTFHDFFPIHILSFTNCNFKNQNLEKLLKGHEEKCGIFEVQHKSHLFSVSNNVINKYEIGEFEKIKNCKIEEMIKLDQKIYDMANPNDSDSDIENDEECEEHYENEDI